MYVHSTYVCSHNKGVLKKENKEMKKQLLICTANKKIKLEKK